MYIYQIFLLFSSNIFCQYCLWRNRDGSCQFIIYINIFQLNKMPSQFKRMRKNLIQMMYVIQVLLNLSFQERNIGCNIIKKLFESVWVAKAFSANLVYYRILSMMSMIHSQTKRSSLWVIVYLTVPLFLELLLCSNTESNIKFSFMLTTV